MPRGIKYWIFLLAYLTITLPVQAQAGFPLKGTWSGEWWLKPGEDHRLLLEFNWDGKTLTGVLNPGRDAVSLQKLSLEPPRGGVAEASAPWILHFEVDLKDQTGTVVHHVVDGKLQNIGAFARFVTGTWNAGSQKGEFKIVRN
jgi:hypothetical protein